MNAVSHFWRLSSAAIVVAILAIAVALFMTTKPSFASQPPPGLSGGVSALDALPPEMSVPADVLDTLRAFDPTVVGPLERAAGKLRKLRSGLGPQDVEIFALRSRTSSVCVIVRGYSGMCPSSVRSGPAGLLFSVGGGYGTADSPPILGGIAADNVAGVEVTADGVAVPATIENNGVFAVLPLDARAVQIIVHYDGFDDKTFDVELG